MPRKRRKRYGKQHTAFLRKNRKHYDALFAHQGGGCAICGREPSTKRRLDLDHDHREMRLRGLLCIRCNRALPSWITAAWLRDAAQYLDNPPAQIILKENND